MSGQSFQVCSAGRRLVVASDARLTRWWPSIAPHIPGATATPPPKVVPAVSAAEADIDLRMLRHSGDARRTINAHLHRVHLEHQAVCVHGVTLANPAGTAAVVLLGGHGAGKTLVAMALAGRRWRPVAGDVTIIEVSPGTSQDRAAGSVTALGGTSAFVVRAAAVRRWFPTIGTRDPVDDLSGRWPAPAPGAVLPVTVAVVVCVDGDSRLRVPERDEVVERPGFDGGSDPWEGLELWHPRGSTPLNCVNARL